MSKRKWPVCAAVLGIGLCLTAISELNAAAQTEAKTLDVMFLHDTHSHLNEFATVENGETQVLGGFAKIKTLIKEQMAENPDTLLLDAGDFSMGTLMQVVFEEEASEIRMLGELGMDATTLGNHEFDYKAKGLANMLNTAVASGDELPAMVISNVDWEAMEAAGLTEDQQILKEAFENYGVQEYVVLEKDDVKIAVTGLFGEDCEDCVPNCPLIFADRVESMKEVVAEIQANEDVDMIACISHSGTWEDEEKSEDEILAKNVPELDLIISGHTHTRLDEAIVHGDTYIVSVGEYGKYLGDLSMTRKENGRWNLDSYELITVDTSIRPDAETQEKVDSLMAMVDSKYLEQFGYTKDQVLCTNEVEFVPQSDTSEKHTELNLGSIMADAYTYAVEQVSEDTNPVDVAVVPSGTIRDSYPTGVITTENVFHSFSLGIGRDEIPGYPMISIYLTGEELKMAAEIDASISDLMTTARLYTDGLYWSYNPNRMILNKVTDVYLCDKNENRIELEDDKLYRVVTDFYTSQMLSGVTDLSYGLLSIVPKFADGTPVENFEDAIVMNGDQELKVWAAIAQYMQSFEDTDGDGIGNVPAKYGTEEGRKVVEDSKNIGDLLKNPNKFFFMILGIAAAAILLVTVLVVIVVKLVRRCIRAGRKKETWIRYRHKLIRYIGEPVIALYSRWKFGITVEPFKEQGNRQYLIIMNHQTTFDQFFVEMAFAGPVYYIATEDIFSIGWVSSLIRYLVAPIPIRKQTVDLQAVRNCFQVAKEGGTIALAPEGNRTYSGKTEYMNPAIVKLLKKLKLPLAIFRIEGGYGVQPRWSDVVRKGKMRAYVSRVVEPEEYSKMSDEELLKLIQDGIDVNEAKLSGNYIHSKSAEYLERAIYVCPHCGLAEFESHGQEIECKKCGRKIQYLPTKELQGVGFDFPFRFVADWYDYQCDFVNGLDLNRYIETPMFEDRANMAEVIVYKRKQPICQDAEITLYGNRILVRKENEAEYDFSFDKISAVTVLGRNKMNIYAGEKIYQFKGSKRFNALKYVNIFYRYKNMTTGDGNGKFLGL